MSNMGKISREKKVLVACVLLSSALTLAAVGWRLETETSGTWAVDCGLEGLDFCYVGTQVEDTRYLADIGIENSRLYTSRDSCIWSEVEISAFDETVDKWRNDLALFKTLDNNLGMVWVDTEPSSEKKPRAAYFLSTFDGQDWSGPVFLFYRENYCVDLVDALPFDNGAAYRLGKQAGKKHYGGVDYFDVISIAALVMDNLAGLRWSHHFCNPHSENSLFY